MGDDSADLARRLREAFERLGAARVDDDERGRLHRRLIAISDAAKHDTARAAERLELWFEELRARERGAAADS